MTSAPITTSLLILADDLTGTADSAVGCANRGLRTLVTLSPKAGATAEVVAIDTDSRRLLPDEAAQRCVDSWQQWQGRYRHLFKKLDSTLRGNVAAEIAALVPLAGMAVVAPAFPATGRTTRNGHQWLNEQPVEESEIWRNEGLTGHADLLAMLRTAGLRTAHLGLKELRQTADELTRQIQALQQQGYQAVVCDGESDDDLARLARASASLTDIFHVGSAGLGRHLPEALGLTDSLRPAAQGSSEPTPAINHRPMLSVVGSMTEVSRQQALQLQQRAGARLRVFELTPDQLRHAPDEATRHSTEHAMADALEQGLDVLVCIARNHGRNAAEGPVLAKHLGELLAPLLARIDTLFVTGGETARALLTSAGITSLLLTDEPDTGMAGLQTELDARPLRVITKAGGFGDDAALARLWQRHGTTESRIYPSSDEDKDMSERPVVGITMGDAAGVGPEIIIKSLGHDSVYELCRPLVIGDAGRLEEAARILERPISVRAITQPSEARFEPGTVDCIDLGLIPADLVWGKVSPIAGDAAYQYIARTVELTRAGELDAICTAPLNKAALHAGGHVFPGHTELLAHLTGIDEVSMMLVTPKMKVIHVTTHMGLIDAINRIEPGLVQRTIERAHDTLARAGIDSPRIAVCGINPHAGENGLFGHGEEEEKIVPAIENLRARGWDVEGPLPADTLFFRAGRGDFDCVVAMYHDQGHGPVKVMGLEAGVNVTVGLPVIRTSVDHGTAFDIAGQGIADERSMLEALRQAVELATRHAATA
ncbi:4-hydroxythreonine-4-phosphate dehydrogenase PdxA [Kushneria phosphatilytica]|uniref:4-hydroxythreonine-4-phosphate dehydrogenase PdxA n=2 Tax=Kushneria phosphatilytica TaxID=657387 RepID=A0A5C1A3C4_9GAMM|nr:4-hydroxythreonine-4-phosphate dehydrogenase PdxA [Kushneria phosphatilytica]